MGDVPHEALDMIEYRDEPPVLVFADSEAARRRLSDIVRAIGCRVADAAPIEGAVARLDQQVLARLVLVSVARDPGPEFDRLLDRLEAGARSDRFNSVVSTGPGLVDVVWSRASHPRLLQLCDPSAFDEIGSVAAALEERPLRLHDAARDGNAARLQQLSEEISRIAAVLAAISEEHARAEFGPAGAGDEDELDAGTVRAIIRARRMRDQFFRSDLFADPAWDMMLDLMAARLEQRRVAVSSLCIAAAVPATTALRWIKSLTDSGVFVRSADPQDGRRVYIELSSGAASALAGYLKAAQRLSSPIL
jgi:hypothetical protein